VPEFVITAVQSVRNVCSFESDTNDVGFVGRRLIKLPHVLPQSDMILSSGIAYGSHLQGSSCPRRNTSFQPRQKLRIMQINLYFIVQSNGIKDKMTIILASRREKTTILYLTKEDCYLVND
jgi:hypothetical protein